jgi:hypothetical protein
VDFYVAGTKKEYQVKSGLRFTLPNLDFSDYNIKKYVNEEGEKIDIWNAITDDAKIFVILSLNNKKIYNLFLDFNEGVEEKFAPKNCVGVMFASSRKAWLIIEK